MRRQRTKVVETSKAEQSRIGAVKTLEGSLARIDQMDEQDLNTFVSDGRLEHTGIKVAACSNIEIRKCSYRAAILEARIADAAQSKLLRRRYSPHIQRLKSPRGKIEPSIEQSIYPISIFRI